MINSIFNCLPILLMLIVRPPLIPPIFGPNITLLSPLSGNVGSNVNVIGTGFGSSQGGSTITMNGLTMTVNSWSSTNINCVIPNTFTGPIVVTVNGLSSGGAIFTIGTVTDFGGYRPELYTSFGMNTPGGRGIGATPKIIRVVNLSNTVSPLSGPAGDGTYSGSFISAVQDNYPGRFVIFDVSGTIDSAGYLPISNPYLTVAGQTAPAPGIQIKGYGLAPTSHDMVFQHLIIRPGDTGASNGMNALENWTGSSMIVWDHCTSQWSPDDSTPISASNITLYRTLICEALQSTPRSPGEDGKFVLMMQNAQNICVLQSLSHSCMDRHPYGKGNTRTFMANTLISNPGFENSIYADPAEPSQSGPIFATNKFNWFRRGPSTTATYICRVRFLQAGSQLYLANNFNDGQGFYNPEFVNLGGGIDPRVGFEPVTLPAFTPQPENTLLTYLTPRVGARPLERDSQIVRIINEVNNRTGAIISSQATVGGWPVYANNTSPLTIVSNPWDVMDAVGRTRFEYQLEAIARAKEGPV